MLLRLRFGATCMHLPRQSGARRLVAYAIYIGIRGAALGDVGSTALTSRRRTRDNRRSRQNGTDRGAHPRTSNAPCPSARIGAERHTATSRVTFRRSVSSYRQAINTTPFDATTYLHRWIARLGRAYDYDMTPCTQFVVTLAERCVEPLFIQANPRRNALWLTPIISRTNKCSCVT